MSAADLDRRFYAFAIDRALAWSIDAAAAVVLVQLLGPDRVWIAVAAVVGVVLLVGGAFAVVLGRTGATPGNAIAAIRVVREGSGAPVGVPAALLRQLVLGLATLPTLGLGVATLAWTAAMDSTGRRRGWHDHLVGSVVVDVRPVPEAQPEPDTGPRHVVNLTALRLVPVPAQAPVTAPAPVHRPASPPPAGPPPIDPPADPPADSPAPRHAADDAPTPAPARQQLGYPLVPEPRPEPAPAAGGAHASPATAEPPAPPRWRIGFDSGESFVVEGLVLVGRRPEPRDGEEVRHLVPLPSTDMSLSKTHAQLQVAADGALVVMDRGSTNGSILIRQGVPRGLPSGKAATLVDGDRVRFGDRELSVVREA
ncbi:RDD family protein [Nocardioides sp. YIM 152315]|uniref:RDD family protein n=1 Tax=Nocardioides sp. YIM 152315 TaxID=3031760 RepID=UPI0023DAE0BA|nr:RDD family protein [Nocardioides sp. YIM 152315]MDF1604830.1 RDD family protein [Nocardioides sp. YIM 152315]